MSLQQLKLLKQLKQQQQEQQQNNQVQEAQNLPAHQINMTADEQQRLNSYNQLTDVNDLFKEMQSIYVKQALEQNDAIDTTSEESIMQSFEEEKDQNPALSEKDRRTVFISHLDQNALADDVKNAVAVISQNVKIEMKRNSAQVEFETEEQARNCISQLSGMTIKGRSVRISIKKVKIHQVKKY